MFQSERGAYHDNGNRTGLENEFLVMRTVNSEGKSYGGFLWPLTVGEYAEAPIGGTILIAGMAFMACRGAKEGGIYSGNNDSKWLLVA
jgi:hypothetical protein